MENVLFKISYPAEFHAQTAIEAAMTLRSKLLERRIDAAHILQVTIRTHEACLRIIDKSGPLSNPADRDHCIQYMVAVSLLFGRLTAADYEDDIASDPRIDALRQKMQCIENPSFTTDYHNPEKRAIANSLLIELNDGSTLEETVEYPLGHKRRRAQGIPLLEAKFRKNLARRYGPEKQQTILDACSDQARLEDMTVNDFIDMFVPAD
jgi:2-methylcitrate dehydratase